MNNIKKKSFWRLFWHAILLRPFLRLVLGVNIKGRENLENLSRYIIIANHNSHLDILLLFYILPISKIHRTHAIADEAYFSKNRIVFRIVNFLYSPIWLTRGKLKSKSHPLENITAQLDKGDNLIVFPEGTRGTPGELTQFKSGIGRIVKQFPDIPVLPVYLTGPERALPRGSAFLLPIWNDVIIGPQQKCTGSHREVTKLLHDVLLELKHSNEAKRHHREYQNHSALKNISFIGIDGSGKSTMSRMVSESLSMESKVSRISDDLEFYLNGKPKDMQPILMEKVRIKISSYAKHAKSLKLYKIPKLVDLLLRDHLLSEIKRWYHPEYVTMDGSSLINLLAWSVLYKGDKLDSQSCSKAIGFLTGKGQKISHKDSLFKDFPEMLYLKHIRAIPLSIPDAVIFIDISSDEACKRIEARGEEKQVHETADKLGKLRKGYQLVCDVIQNDWNVPILIVDGTKSKQEIQKESLTFLANIFQEEV